MVTLGSMVGVHLFLLEYNYLYLYLYSEYLLIVLLV